MRCPSLIQCASSVKWESVQWITGQSHWSTFRLWSLDSQTPGVDSLAGWNLTSLNSLYETAQCSSNWYSCHVSCTSNNSLSSRCCCVAFEKSLVGVTSLLPWSTARFFTTSLTACLMEDGDITTSKHRHGQNYYVLATPKTILAYFGQFILGKRRTPRTAGGSKRGCSALSPGPQVHLPSTSASAEAPQHTTGPPRCQRDADI